MGLLGAESGFVTITGSSGTVMSAWRRREEERKQRRRGRRERRSREEETTGGLTKTIHRCLLRAGCKRRFMLHLMKLVFD